MALFETVDPSGRRLTGRALERRLVLAMTERRAAPTGLPPSTCCHTFRATGVTAYLSTGGANRAMTPVYRGLLLIGARANLAARGGDVGAGDAPRVRAAARRVVAGCRRRTSAASATVYAGSATDGGRAPSRGGEVEQRIRAWGGARRRRSPAAVTEISSAPPVSAGGRPPRPASSWTEPIPLPAVRGARPPATGPAGRRPGPRRWHRRGRTWVERSSVEQLEHQPERSTASGTRPPCAGRRGRRRRGSLESDRDGFG